MAGVERVLLAHVEDHEVVGPASRRRASSSIAMNGIRAVASASSWVTVLPPLMLVRNASVRSARRDYPITLDKYLDRLPALV